MSRSKKDAVGGHRKPSEQCRRWWRMRPYGLKFPGFVTDYRRDHMHRCEMRGRARMLARAEVLRETGA